jgi:hypothetical protein
MAESPRSEDGSQAYWSYLLRLWRLGGARAVLRASLTSVTGEERVFPSLEALVEHLRSETEERREDEPIVNDEL